MGLHSIEICAGVGMLGEGLRSGLQHLGIAHRTVCYVEREAYAAAVLAARIEEGSLDPAPVWTDLLTFDAAAWHGAVDCIVAGFPCQDLSLAGKRAGLDGARSGLFFDILDIADACGARGLFLENVAGIASATASVVDEAEGELEERAAARVLGELADRGWHAEWLTLSASDVGASHGRARWFCWAWRSVDDAERAQRGQTRSARAGGQQGDDRGRTETHGGVGEPVEILGDTGLQHQHLQQRHEGAEHPPAGDAMGHATGGGRREGWSEPGREQGRSDAAEHGGAVANARCERRQQISRGASGHEGTNEGRSSKDDHIAPGTCAAVADAGCPGCEGSEQRGTLHGNRGGASTWTS